MNPDILMTEARKKELKEFSNIWNLSVDLNSLNEVLTHSSFKVKNSKSEDYQSWETLGDSVLDLIVIEILIFEYDIKDEGLLTAIRSNMVSNKALINIENQLNLTKIVQTSNKYVIQDKDKADIIEALFGLIYKSMGIKFCKDFFSRFSKSRLKDEIIKKQKIFKKTGKLLINAKNTLQEYCQENKLPLPNYTILHEEGVPHSKMFIAQCQIINTKGDILKEKGIGSNKKEAEKKAAQKICQEIGI